MTSSVAGRRAGKKEQQQQLLEGAIGLERWSMNSSSGIETRTQRGVWTAETLE